MPANHTLPLTDVTTPGAAETLKGWYTDNKDKCVSAASVTSQATPMICDRTLFSEVDCL